MGLYASWPKRDPYLEANCLEPFIPVVTTLLYSLTASSASFIVFRKIIKLRSSTSFLASYRSRLAGGGASVVSLAGLPCFCPDSSSAGLASLGTPLSPGISTVTSDVKLSSLIAAAIWLRSSISSFNRIRICLYKS